MKPFRKQKLRGMVFSPLTESQDLSESTLYHVQPALGKYAQMHTLGSDWAGLPLQTSQILNRVSYQQGWGLSETVPGSVPACGPDKL